MKKYLLTFLFLFLSASPAFAFTITPQNSNLSSNINWADLGAGNTLILYGTTGEYYASSETDSGAITPEFITEELTPGIYRLVEVESVIDAPICTSTTYQGCLDSVSEIDNKEMGIAVATESMFTASLIAIIGSISIHAGFILIAVLTFIGLLLGADWSWRFIKRHIGSPISGSGYSTTDTPDEASANIRTSGRTPWGKI